MSAPIGPNRSPTPPQPATPTPKQNHPAAPTPLATPLTCPSSQAEKIQDARLQVQQRQQAIWLKLLPAILKPLQLPAAAAHLKIRDLINFLTLRLIQDLFSHEITTDDDNNYCLGFLALLQDDPYDTPSINNLNALISIIEERKTPVTQEGYTDLKRALNHFIKTQGCQGRADQTMADLVDPAELNNILCTPDQDTQNCQQFLQVIHSLLSLVLVEMNTDLGELNEILKEGRTDQNDRNKPKDESYQAEALFTTVRKHSKEIEKTLQLIQQSFSCINPRVLRPLLESFKKTLALIDTDARTSTKFLEECGRKNTSSQKHQDEQVAALLRGRGVNAELIPLILHAQSSEAVTLLEEAATAPSSEKELKEELAKYIKLRDHFREHAAKAAKPNIDDLKQAFLTKLHDVQIKRAPKKTKQGLQKFVQKVETLDEAAPVIDRVCKSLKSQHTCLRLLHPLIAILDIKIATLTVDEEALSRQISESLFNEEQSQVKKKKLSVVEFLPEEMLPEEEEHEPLPEIPAVSLPAQPVSRWQNLHTRMLAPKTIENWRTEKTTPEMEAISTLCMRHAAFHFSLLRSQIKLMLQARDSNQLQHIPLFSRMLARSCSLLTEQLLTAQLAMRDKGAKLKHYHLMLAEGQISPKDHESWNLFQALDGGEIFHRYPHQFAQRCKEQSLPIPVALKWLLEPNACSYRELFQLAEKTLHFMGKVLPEADVKGLIGELAEKKQHSGLSADLKEKLNPVCRTLDACLTKAEKLIQRSGIKEAIHWRDVHAQLQGLQRSLALLIDCPQAETLSAQGDMLLAQAQYVDELIENGRLLLKHGYLLDSHDLEAFRLLRNIPPDDAEQQLIADLNGEDGTHYPHRFIQNEGRIPNALKWRFDAARYAIPGQDFDREALEHESDRLSGFKHVKKGKENASRHPLFGLRDELIRWIGSIAELSDRRLMELI